MIRAAAVMVAVAGCAGSAGGGLNGPDVRDVDQACLGNGGQPPAVAGPVSSPPTVPPQDVHRIVGGTSVRPDERTMIAIDDAHVSGTQATIKLCLDTAGVPKTYRFVRSSCFPRYDAQIVAAVHGWRYEPYLVDGVATEVCTAATFFYRRM